jgi:hypothetical protein
LAKANKQEPIAHKLLWAEIFSEGVKKQQKLFTKTFRAKNPHKIKSFSGIVSPHLFPCVFGAFLGKGSSKTHKNIGQKNRNLAGKKRPVPVPAV